MLGSLMRCATSSDVSLVIESSDMGEGRRRLLAFRQQLCRCGSGRVAGACCLQGSHWFKRPAVVALRTPLTAKVVEKCYMRELRACDGGVSGEHLISESVIRVLAGDGQFTIGGTPWLSEGETRAVGRKSLTANCLCERHNGALSPLDDAARSLFVALKSCLEKAPDARNYIVSGHDLERWLLKTLKVLAVSQNLARGRQRLAGTFASDVRILEMFEEIGAWPEGAGLYCVMRAGDLAVNHRRFQIAPVTNASDEICALWTNILGLSFVLVLERSVLTNLPQLAGAVFRPRSFNIRHPSGSHELLLTWADGNPHRGDMTLEFLRDVDTT
jgi:hypothetical protein